MSAPQMLPSTAESPALPPDSGSAYAGPGSWARGGERVIALGRAVVAVAALVTVWLDPEAPSRFVETTYLLLAAYAVYSLILVGIVWLVPLRLRAFPLLTHVIDLALFTLFIYLTNGVSSPYYAYFTFALVCAVIRWQWPAALATAVVGLTAFVGIGAYAEYVLRESASQIDRVVLRSAYLIVLAGLLIFLGHYTQQARQQIARLAQWPRVMFDDRPSLFRHLARHAAHVVAAPRSLVVWRPRGGETPVLESWPPLDARVAAGLARQGDSVVPPAVGRVPFVCRRLQARRRTIYGEGGERLAVAELPIHPWLAERLTPMSVLALPLDGTDGAGWLLLFDKPRLTLDDLAIGGVVARGVVASITHFNLLARSRTAAVQEARTRLGRDLHDGLLQSLTAARLQLHQLARELGRTADPDVQARLEAIEATITANQRELRGLVDVLRRSPESAARVPGSEPAFAALVRRMRSDWGLEVEGGVDIDVSPGMQRELVLLAQEALANAAKHGRASRATVAAHVEEGVVWLRVTDNGSGFPFVGRRDADGLAAMGLCPTSLCDRVVALGGALEVESSSAGASIELRIPLRAEVRT